MNFSHGRGLVSFSSDTRLITRSTRDLSQPLIFCQSPMAFAQGGKAGGEVSPSIPTIPAAQLVGHDGPILDVAFTNDGKYAITGGNDRTVRLWNPTRIDPGYVTSSAQQHGDGPPPPALPIQAYTDGHSHPVAAVAVDPQSTTLVSTSDRTVVVTDIVSKRVKRRFHSHSGRINAVACSDNAEAILSSSYDGKVCLFDGRSWNAAPIQTLDEAKDSVTAVSVWQQQQGGAAGAATAEIITASVDGVVRYYDLRKGQIRCDDVGDAITGLALTNDGHCAAVSCLDGTIRLIERKTGDLLHQYSGAHSAGNYGLQVSFTADDSSVVSGSEDGSVVIYDVVEGNATQTLKRHTRPVCAIAAHPKREQTSVVISGGYDGNAIVWAANPFVSSKWDRDCS